MMIPAFVIGPTAYSFAKSRRPHARNTGTSGQSRRGYAGFPSPRSSQRAAMKDLCSETIFHFFPPLLPAKPRPTCTRLVDSAPLVTKKRLPSNAWRLNAWRIKSCGSCRKIPQMPQPLRLLAAVRNKIRWQCPRMHPPNPRKGEVLLAIAIQSSDPSPAP